MSSELVRVTMIKLASDDCLPIALKGFEAFTRNQKKNGKPYIISMQAGPAEGNIKEQGFNFVTKSVFMNEEDMEYYEKDCEGHRISKDFLKANAPVSGLMTAIFKPSVNYDG